MIEDQIPTVGGPPAPKLIGDKAQLELMEALGRLDSRLARMYEGAMRAFGAVDNPECLAQCALSMREIFDKLHLATKHQPPARTVSMRTKANEVRLAWQILIQRSAAYQSGTGTWAGEVDRPLIHFLGVVAEFINYLGREMPTLESSCPTPEWGTPGHRWETWLMTSRMAWRRCHRSCRREP